MQCPRPFAPRTGRRIFMSVPKPIRARRVDRRPQKPTFRGRGVPQPEPVTLAAPMQVKKQDDRNESFVSRIGTFADRVGVPIISLVSIGAVGASVAPMVIVGLVAYVLLVGIAMVVMR